MNVAEIGNAQQIFVGNVRKHLEDLRIQRNTEIGVTLWKGFNWLRIRTSDGLK
jgi:hypothetical protein